MKTKHYSFNKFNKIYSNAYAVIIKNSIYEIYDDYETEDGNLVTAYVLSNNDSIDRNDIIEVSHDIENGGVDYNEESQKFHFTRDVNDDIGWFRVLVVASM